MKKIFTLIFLTLGVLCKAQDYPVYNQYFNNPYLINPAFVGSTGYTEISATHRRQWIGVEDAPVATTITVQYPTAKGVSLGLGLYSQSSVLLNRTSMLATFGYRVVLGEDQFLRFGISGGLGNYHLDVSGVSDESLNDNAITKMLGPNYFFDGQFGVSYMNKGFTLGFAVPRIFDTRKYNEGKFNDVSFQELKYNLISASYRIGGKEKTVSFEPYLIYRMGEGIKEKFEALGTVYYKDLFWIGGSYRQKYGPTAFIGVTVKNFRFGYSYELPTSPLARYSKGSHEIQLNLRLGKNKNGSVKRPLAEKTAVKTAPKEVKKDKEAEKAARNDRKEINETAKSNSSTAEVKPRKGQEQEPIAKESTASGEELNATPLATTTKSSAKTSEGRKLTEEVKKEAPGAEVKLEARKSSHPLELQKNNYLVVGVFKMVKNAENFKKQLKEKGYVTFLGYSSKTGSFYLYLSKYSDIEDARKERSGVRELDVFNDAWIMSVE